MKVFLTGVTGLIGSHLARLLVRTVSAGRPGVGPPPAGAKQERLVTLAVIHADLSIVRLTIPWFLLSNFRMEP